MQYLQFELAATHIFSIGQCICDKRPLVLVNRQSEGIISSHILSIIISSSLTSHHLVMYGGFVELKPTPLPQPVTPISNVNREICHLIATGIVKYQSLSTEMLDQDCFLACQVKI